MKLIFCTFDDRIYARSSFIAEPITMTEADIKLSDIVHRVARFIVQNNNSGIDLSITDVIDWIAGVDRELSMNGWQTTRFLEVGNVVFFYLLLRKAVSNDIWSCTEYSFKTKVMSCLFIAYSYNGSEISYPRRTFQHQLDRKSFFRCCVLLTSTFSADMLAVNQKGELYQKLLDELINL